MSKLPTTFPSLEGQDPRSLFEAVRQMFSRVAAAFNNPDFGATAARPTSQLTVGQPYFDTTLGTPIWWAGSAWVNSAGTPV